MNKEIKAFIRIQAIISLSFNFFINGMISSLIYHKADMVLTDSISISIDLMSTCLFIFIFGAVFSKINLRSEKLLGVFDSKSKLTNFLSKLFKSPLLFGSFLGFISAICLIILIVPAFLVLDIGSLPFGLYISLKVIFSGLLGAGVMILGMYIGLFKTENK